MSMDDRGNAGNNMITIRISGMANARLGGGTDALYFRSGPLSGNILGRDGIDVLDLPKHPLRTTHRALLALFRRVIHDPHGTFTPPSKP